MRSENVCVFFFFFYDVVSTKQDGASARLLAGRLSHIFMSFFWMDITDESSCSQIFPKRRWFNLDLKRGQVCNLSKICIRNSGMPALLCFDWIYGGFLHKPQSTIQTVKFNCP